MIASGIAICRCIHSNIRRAHSGCLPVSQALIKALHVTMSGNTIWCCIASKACRARCSLWLLDLLTSPDQGTISDDAWHRSVLLHHLEHSQGLHWLLAALASAGQYTVRDDAWHRSLLLHRLEHLQVLL